MGEKSKTKIVSLEKTKLIYNTSPALQDDEVKQDFKDLRTKFCIVSIDIVSNNFSFICKSFYVSKLLDEIGLFGIQNDTYKLENKLKEKAINDKINFLSKFLLEVQIDFKTLPIIYWLAKICRTPAGTKFSVAFRNHSTKTC